MYKSYEVTLAGSADRIMTMAETEQANRIAWENRALSEASDVVRRGQWLGAAAAFVCIAGSIWLAMNGQTVIAGILAGVSAVGLAGQFLLQRSQ